MSRVILIIKSPFGIFWDAKIPRPSGPFFNSTFSEKYPLDLIHFWRSNHSSTFLAKKLISLVFGRSEVNWVFLNTFLKWTQTFFKLNWFLSKFPHWFHAKLGFLFHFSNGWVKFYAYKLFIINMWSLVAIFCMSSTNIFKYCNYF